MKLVLAVLLLSSASLTAVNAYGCRGGTFYSGSPGVSGGCEVSNTGSRSCIRQQGSDPCMVNGSALGPSKAAHAIVRTANVSPSVENAYQKWTADHDHQPEVPVSAPVYQDYMSSQHQNTGEAMASVGQNAGNVGVNEGLEHSNYEGNINEANQFAGGIQNGENGGSYIHEHHGGYQTEGYRRLSEEAIDAAAPGGESVIMDFALIGLQGNCTDGCFANIYDGAECTDAVLSPLSPMESFTYYTNDAQMSVGNSTMKGTVDDYIGKALLFHNDKNGDFNVDNGLDACGIFTLVDATDGGDDSGAAANSTTDAGEAADDTSADGEDAVGSDSSPAAQIMISTLAVAAVAASVFF